MIKDVNEIIEIINNNGKDGFLVGGAVRDMALHKTPHDYDIATNMSYEDLEKIFPDNYPSGKSFGIITIFYNNDEYQIAHFRNDGDYADNRHCDVNFVESIEEDLKRRDFTINAMAWSEKTGIIDLFGGQEDIKNRVIRTVGNPNDRFNEDGLRMLRAIRFSAQLGFKIEDETFNAIKENAHLIKNVSYERIEQEISKILTSDHPEQIALIHEAGLSKYIMPEFDKLFGCEQNTPWHKYDVAMHTIKALQEVPNDKILRWTMLLHDFGKPDAKTTKDGVDHFYGHGEISKEIADIILKRFKFSNEDRYEVLNLVEHHDIKLKKMPKIRAFISKMGPSFFDKLKLVQAADMAAQSDYKQEEKMAEFYKFFDDVETVINDGSAIRLSDLKIDGNDLMKLGFKGKEIGYVLTELLKECFIRPDFNDKTKLIKKAESFKTQSLDEKIASYKNIFNKNKSKNINIENINIEK